MSVAIRRARRRSSGYGINLTPLLDVILNLMFFFILATTLKKESVEMRVNLPVAAHGEAAEQKQDPSIAVDAGGAVSYKGETMDLEVLALHLFKLAQQGQKAIVIYGDEGVDFGRVIEVMDQCKDAGLIEVRWQLRGKEAAAPKP